MALPLLAQVQPGPVGYDFQVNTYTTAEQIRPSVAADADGDFVVVWRSDGSFGSDNSFGSIQGQRFASDGSPRGSQFQVNTYTTDYQVQPLVAMDADGDFVVVWRSKGSSGTDAGLSIQGQRYDSAGMPVGGEFQINTYTKSVQSHPGVAMGAGGDFVVVWHSYGSYGTDGPDPSVQGQRYDSAGTRIGGQFQVNTYTPGGQRAPIVAVENDNDFVVVWISMGSSGTDDSGRSVQLQRYDSAGMPVGGEIQVNTYTTGDQGLPSVGLEGDGDFVLTWKSEGSYGDDTLTTSIQAQRYASDGAPRGSQFQVNTYTTGGQGYPNVLMEDDGKFVVLWQSFGSPGIDHSGGSIQGQRFDSAGMKIGDQFQVNSYTTAAQLHVSAAAGPGGDFVAAWQSYGSSGSDTDAESIQARRFTLAADFSVTKTDGVSVAVPGQSVVYTIAVLNSGPAGAPATLVDTFPAALACTWTSQAGGGASGNSSGSGNLDDNLTMPAGSSVTYTATCAIDAAATGTLSNTATVFPTALDPVPVNNSATDNNTVLAPQADLSVTKTDGLTSAFAEGTLAYTIVASNSGPSDVPSATLVDTLPADLTCHWTSSAANGATGNTAAASGNLSETLSLPAGSSVTYILDCALAASAKGTLSNTASIGSSVTDPVATNDRATDVTEILVKADLELTLTGPQEAVPGAELTYTFLVTNHGPQDVFGASIVPTFSELLVEVPSVAAFDLAAGSTLELSVKAKVRPDALGGLATSASVQVPPDVVDPASQNDSAASTATLVPTGNLSVSMTTGRVEVVTGKRLTYLVAVGNDGPSDARDVTLRGSFPVVDLRVSCSLGADRATPCDAEGFEAPAGAESKTVDKEFIFDLPAGMVRTYEVEGLVLAEDGVLSGLASVQAAGLVDPHVADNQVQSLTTVVAAELVAESEAQKVSEGRAPDLVFDSSGEAVVVFERQTDGATRIARRRLASTAVPLGDEEPVSDGEGINPAIAFDPLSDVGGSGTVRPDGKTTAGGATLSAWEDTERDPRRVLGELAAGQSRKELTLAAKATDQRRPDVAARASKDGGFLVVWESARSKNGQEQPGSENNRSGIFGRFVNALGGVGRQTLRLNSGRKPDPLRPAVAALGSGFFVAWDTPRSPGATRRRIVGQRLAPDGRTLRGEVFLSGAGRNSQDPAVAWNAETRHFLVVWQELDNEPFGLGARLVAADGKPIGDEILFGEPGDRNPAVTSEPDHFIAVWDREKLGREIPYRQLINLDGTLRGNATGVKSLAERSEAAGPLWKAEEEDSSEPSVAYLPGSKEGEGKQVFFVVWSEEVSETQREIQAQRFALAADLVVSVTDSPDPLPEGVSVLLYTVRVMNLGPSEAQEVVVEQTLPAAATLIQSSGCLEDPTALATCGLGDLAAGETAEYTLEVAIDAGFDGRLDFVSTASSATTPDPFDGDNEGVQLTALGDADLSVGLAPGSARATAGERFTWEVTVRNAGPSPAGGIVVRAPLPEKVTLAAESDCEPGASGEASCPVGDLGRGEERRVDLVVEVGPSLRGKLRQTVSLEALTGDGDLSDNEASAEVGVDVPDLRVGLDAPPSAFPGEPLAFAVTVSNGGSVEAADVAVETALPNGLALVATTGCAEDPAGLPHCSLGAVEAGSERRVTVEASVDPAVTGVLRLGATVTSPSESAELVAEADVLFTEPTVLPLLDGRFEVRVDWRDQRGGTAGEGLVLPYSDNTGFFYFFNPENVDLLVKLIDGGRVNGNFWFFYGGLSDVEYTVTVTDTSTGEEKTYFNPQGEVCGQGDIGAFPGADGALSLSPRRITREGPSAKDGACVAGPESLCLLGGRFRVEAEWASADASGVAQAVSGSDGTGFFWFFNEKNLELAVKVIDGSKINGKFWVFYGALTDVAYTITVTDTETGAVRVYRNPSGEICGRADTSAF